MISFQLKYFENEIDICALRLLLSFVKVGPDLLGISIICYLWYCFILFLRRPFSINCLFVVPRNNFWGVEFFRNVFPIFYLEINGDFGWIWFLLFFKYFSLFKKETIKYLYWFFKKWKLSFIHFLCLSKLHQTNHY